MSSRDECRNLMAKWCQWLITAIFTIAYFVTVMLLSRDRPTFYLDNFHVVSLNKTLIRSTTDTATTTTTIYFDLMINNMNTVVGVYYENPLNLTFTYFPPNYAATNTAVMIGDYVIKPFYQGDGGVKHVRDFVVVQDVFSSAAVDGRRKELRETDVSLGGPAKVVVFGVNLDTKVKFRSIENKRSDLKVGGIVEVNGNTGDVVMKKTIELKYDSGSNKWGVAQWLLFFPLLAILVTIGMCCCINLPMHLMGVYAQS